MTIKEALAEANRKLSKKVDNALTREVYSAVQVNEISAIADLVYESYEPLMYSRREDLGGMADPQNIEIVGGRAKNGVLKVVNVTESDDRYNGSTRKNLPELIEYGHSVYCRANGVGYDFISSKKWRRERYMAPRPFTATTIENMKINKDHVTGVREGLKRQGLRVF